MRKPLCLVLSASHDINATNSCATRSLAIGHRWQSTSATVVAFADVLDRKRPRPRVKISRWATRRRNGEIAGFIFDARFRGEKEKEYSKAAEKKFGLTWRHIQKIVAEEELRSETDKILQNDWQGIFLLNPPSDNGGIKYRLSDMALNPHTLQ